MGFVQQQFLWVLGGLAIPIVIHLMFRRRSRSVNLGTLRFLKVVLQENAKRRKLKRWALLALRMACVALLALLFAQPYLIARDAGGNDRFTAILVDRSASMQQKDKGTRLVDRAVEEARAIVGRTSDSTHVEMAFFDQVVRPVGQSAATIESGKETHAPARELLADIKAPAAIYGGTNYGAALAWARDVSLNVPNRRKELHIFTDLQRSGLDWSQVQPLGSDVQVYLVDLGKAVANNVAVTAARISKPVVRPGKGVSVTATVFNGGPFPIEKLPVVLSFTSGKRKHAFREKLSLEPGGIASLDFSVPALEEGLWQGTVRIEINDDLQFDNQRFVAALCATPLSVLLVDGDPQESPMLAETYFLETALRLALPGDIFADAAFQPVKLDFAQNDSLPDLKRTNLVVLANIARLRNSDAARLAKFVRDGGGLLVISGEHFQADAHQSLIAAGLGVGEFRGIARSGDLPWRLHEWDESHPIFEPFNDPQHGDLRRLAFNAFTRIKPEGDVHVLARFRGGDPALLEKGVGAGRVLWFTSACDREWSDWTRSRLYLPFVHQLLGRLAGLTEGGPVRETLLDSTASVPRDEPPGVYRRDGYWEVLNVSPRESETERCTREDFAKRFQLVLADEAQPIRTVAAVAPALQSGLRDDEVWHWLVFCLLGVLMMETFVGNRSEA